LLALTEVQGGANGSRASLSQMRMALDELNRAFRAIQRSIRGARRDPAWGFSRNPFRGPMEKRFRREMEESLDEQRSVLAALKATIADWSRPWQPPAKKVKKQPQPPERPEPARTRRESAMPGAFQTEFAAF
jgi:hypothetical protein